jgi:hypothetical protein
VAGGIAGLDVTAAYPMPNWVSYEAWSLLQSEACRSVPEQPWPTWRMAVDSVGEANYGTRINSFRVAVQNNDPMACSWGSVAESTGKTKSKGNYLVRVSVNDMSISLTVQVTACKWKSETKL